MRAYGFALALGKNYLLDRRIPLRGRTPMCAARALPSAHSSLAAGGGRVRNASQTLGLPAVAWTGPTMTHFGTDLLGGSTASLQFVWRPVRRRKEKKNKQVYAILAPKVKDYSYIFEILLQKTLGDE